MTLAASMMTPVSADSESAADEDGKGLVGFLPVPVFITEPALGYGLGAGLLYFHPVDEGADTPPDITGVGGGYTESDSWFVGGGHFASWRDDSIRYAVGGAYVDLNLEYYLGDLPFSFQIDGGVIFQDVKFRIDSSDFFLGTKLLFVDTATRFDAGTALPVDLGAFNSTNVGLSAQVTYDRRDNIFTPNKGQLVQFDLWRYDDALGGDFDYWNLSLRFNSFHPLGERFVLGLRLEAAEVDGRPPFYAFPFVSLRGVPALRYQNRFAGVFETELRWNIVERWALVVFGGVGEIHGDVDAFDTLDDIYAGGVGGRFLFRPDLDLWVGVDLAIGPEDTVGYIQIGHAW
jgi:hypothetical protein